MNKFPRLLAAVAAALCLAQPAAAQRVWISPPGVENGRALRSLFEHPDDWRDARALVDVLSYTDLNFNKQFTDDELRSMFAQLKKWNLKLAMEVGAVKEWGQTGEITFNKEQPAWQRFKRLGAEIHAIALDEPLICVRQHLKKPDQYAVDETASYIANVRRNWPDMLIGDIETYPSMSLADNIWWIDSLNRKLAGMNVRGLDFYRLDVNWAVFTVRNEGSWQEVKKLEQYCRSKKLPFSLIYWPADYPALKRQGFAADDTWYISVLRMAQDYLIVGGHPDQYVIESWVGAPDRTVPDSADFTFTRTVRDLVRRFVR